ncbi:MAG: hypothetical protein QOI40_4734 [Alphaproteobacteria bacterium]|nr:hypothetical protein [Alphaproteobacteria bacterium]
MACRRRGGGANAAAPSSTVGIMSIESSDGGSTMLLLYLLTRIAALDDLVGHLPCGPGHLLKLFATREFCPGALNAAEPAVTADAITVRCAGTKNLYRSLSVALHRSAGRAACLRDTEPLIVT